MSSPSPDEVRAALAGFDDRGQKIVIGLLSVMINDPERVRDREWVAERLTELTLLAGGFEDEDPQASVRAIEAFLQEQSEGLVRAALLLFQRVGLDLAPRASEGGGFSFEDAVQCGLAYMPAARGNGSA